MKLITYLIQKAGERKKTNQNIHYKGEHIDEKTVQEDFSSIYNLMKIEELYITDNVTMEQVSNELFAVLSTLKSFVIFSRSDETIIMLKLDTDKMLVVDSHKEKHGVVDISAAVQYINKLNKYRGTVNIGYV